MYLGRFVDCEQWRKEIGLDDLVPTWEYKEKEDVFRFYPQYYHKTDKVSIRCPRLPFDPTSPIEERERVCRRMQAYT